MTSTFGFTPGQPPEWDRERFMHGDEVDTAVITLERNRLTFAWKCADVDTQGLGLRLGASAVTLGGLLKHLAWVEELYFQNQAVANALNGRPRKTLGWKTPAEAFDEHLRSLQQAGGATIG